jgi:hypothetical protein
MDEDTAVAPCSILAVMLVLFDTWAFDKYTACCCFILAVWFIETKTFDEDDMFVATMICRIDKNPTINPTSK